MLFCSVCKSALDILSGLFIGPQSASSSDNPKRLVIRSQSTNLARTKDLSWEDKRGLNNLQVE